MTTPPSGHSHSIWKEYVVPTARALETFFWRLAFFSVVVCVLSSYNPLKPGPKPEPPAAKRVSASSPMVVAGSTSR